MDKARMVKAGQKWTRLSDKADCRVMGMVENWVVVRFPRAIPFCVYYNDFIFEYQLAAGGREL